MSDFFLYIVLIEFFPTERLKWVDEKKMLFFAKKEGVKCVTWQQESKRRKRDQSFLTMIEEVDRVFLELATMKLLLFMSIEEVYIYDRKHSTKGHSLMLKRVGTRANECGFLFCFLYTTTGVREGEGTEWMPMGGNFFYSTFPFFERNDDTEKWTQFIPFFVSNSWNSVSITSHPPLTNLYTSWLSPVAPCLINVGG